MDNSENVNHAAAALAAAIAAAGASGAVNREEVERIAGEMMTAKFGAVLPGLLAEMDKRAKAAAAAAVGAAVRSVVVQNGAAPKIEIGLQHYNFELLLRLCSSRDSSGFVPPIYLYGPAGTGKTTAAANVARSLGLPFYFNGSIDSEYKLSGFVDAGGVFRSRPFFEAYAHGGVYLFDELDSSLPGAVLAFNSALANGFADFPCGVDADGNRVGGRVQRHPDCIILAAGNSCMRGDGQEEGYDRIRQDASFRDRFAFLEWGVDAALEAAMIGAPAPADWSAPVVPLGGPVEWSSEMAAAWLRIVRACRENAARNHIMDFEITPRASKTGMAYICNGVPVSTVVDLVIRKGLKDSEWSQVARGVDFEGV